jgi:hypothetical protein
MELLNLRAHDGSRRFAALPQRVTWRKLRRHLESLPGLKVTGFLTDFVTEGWLDFTYREHKFTVNDQFGEFWFFVEDPAAPEELLNRVAEHCEVALRGGR